MINNSKRLKNQEHNTNLDSSSQFNYHFPIKSQKPNNISFKNSVYLMKSEQRTNTHRQYLIDFIRDNNNKNKKQKNEKIIQTKKNSNLTKREEQDEKPPQEIIDEKNFFNDYFNYQSKQERLEQNKSNPNELIMDIVDYLGDDALHPINIDLMNIRMKNFIPGKISTKSFGLINSYAANTNQGIDRNYNDDRVKIIINMNKPNNYINKSPWPLMSYFGIFDGHNGDHCAEFLRKNLLQYIYTNPNFPNNVEKAIKEGFINADKYYIKNLCEINKEKNSSNIHDLCNNSGSCGLILLIVDTKIYIANVGDSRCVVSCQNGKIQKDVTRDHKPEFPYEKQRIYYHGGKIYRNETIFSEEVKNIKNRKTGIKEILLGPYRVDPGKLSVSRTIGDAKAKLEKYGGIPMVIVPEPDVYVFDFLQDDIDYFIMGCDGIFDRIKSYEIFRCVETVVNNEKEMINKNTRFNNCFNTCYDRKINMNTTCGNIVDIILRLSMIRKSYDNVTCIMVAFKDLISGKNSGQKDNDKKYNNLIQSYDRYNLKSSRDRYGKNNANISKDIHISRVENENRKNVSQENNNKTFYKKIDNNSSSNVDLNKLRNNYLYDDKMKKNKNDKYENNKENENINQSNNKKIQSQSQEKKIRELITLFSINNKKRPDNDNTSFLYNTYNSKNKDKDINHDFNNTQRTIYKNNILFNSSTFGVNINNKNSSVIENNKERFEQKNKSSTIFAEQNIQNKYSKVNNIQLLDLKKYKPSYFNLKNYPKKISNLKMSSFSIEEEENDLDAKEEKPYAINNQTNRIKSNSTENLYATPIKSQAFSNNRITSRKIVRKTNNIFINKSSIKEGHSSESINIDKTKPILNNNNKNNFFHSVVLSASKKDNNRYKYKNDNHNIESNNNSVNSLVNIRKINYEKYKVKNPRFNISKNNESVNDTKFNRYEKIGKSKYEKDSKFINENLSGPSSISIIYTKKRKVK